MIRSKSDYRYYVREDAKNNSFNKKLHRLLYRLLNHVVPGGDKSCLEFYSDDETFGVLHQLSDYLESDLQAVHEV